MFCAQKGVPRLIVSTDRSYSELCVASKRDALQQQSIDLQERSNEASSRSWAASTWSTSRRTGTYQEDFEPAPWLGGAHSRSPTRQRPDGLNSPTTRWSKNEQTLPTDLGLILHPAAGIMPQDLGTKHVGTRLDAHGKHFVAKPFWNEK